MEGVKGGVGVRDSPSEALDGGACVDPGAVGGGSKPRDARRPGGVRESTWVDVADVRSLILAPRSRPGIC